MSGRRSRQKGARGEREAAALLRGHGYGMKRGCQHAGGFDSPDVAHDSESGLPDFPLHTEVKRVERLNLYEAMAQAVKDASGGDKPPCVLHRRNHGEWLLTMRFEDLVEILKGND